MVKGGLAFNTKILLFRTSGTITPNAVVGHGINKLARRNKYDDDDDQGEVESSKQTVQAQEKEIEEHEKGYWIPHPRTGIYYPKGHEWVMEDVPVGAAYFAQTFWFRDSDIDGV